jgi:multiple sugar transport system substrate-binding protein
MGKRTLALILVVVMLPAALLLAEGAKEGTKGGPIVLKILTWDQGPGKAAWLKSISKFEAAHAGVKVEMSDVPWQEFVDSMVKLQMAKALPDVFDMYDATIGSFYAMGSLLPLDKYLPAGFREKFYDRQWDHAFINGKTYGLVMRNGAHVLFYNKAMFKAAGLGDAPPKTYEDVIKAAKACTIDKGGTGTPTQYGYADGYGDEEGYHQIRSLMMASGSGPVDMKDFHATMNSPASIAALQLVVDLNNKYKVVPPGALTKTNTMRNEEFVNGLCAIVEGGNWIEAAVMQANPNFELGVTFLPYNTKYVSTSQGGSAAFVSHSVAANTKYPELAAALAIELTSAEFVSDYCKALNLLPSRIDTVESDPYWKSGNFPTYIKATTLANYGALPKHPKVVELTKIVQTAIEKSLMGQSSVEDALNQAAAEWNKIR